MGLCPGLDYPLHSDGDLAFPDPAVGGKKEDVTVCLVLFAAQLVLNVLWSVIFFGFHAIFFALVCLILLFIVLLCLMILAPRVSRSASLLLIPYLIWLCIAGYLNASIFYLNPV